MRDPRSQERVYFAGASREEVTLKAKKMKKTAKKKVATSTDRAEAAQYVETLKANRQIARGKTLTPGTTHQVERDAKGRKILVRKRYSAI